MGDESINKILAYSYKELFGIFLVFAGVAIEQFASSGTIGVWGITVGSIFAIVGWIKIIKNGIVVLRILSKQNLE